MISAAREMLPRPAAVIVGEPTGMRLATQHKGLCLASTKVTGIEAHSSLTHRGESAVMIAGELIAHLRRIGDELSSQRASGASAFEPPCTTVSVNKILGGTAFNITAGLCEFMWDIRALPGERSADVLTALARRAGHLLAELAAQGKRCEIETTVIADAPPLQAEEGGAAAALVRAVARQHEPDIAVPFGTEGGYFQQAGWSTVVCGPGQIEQAHKPDEFIERAQLEECAAFLDRLIRRQLVEG